MEATPTDLKGMVPLADLRSMFRDAIGSTITVVINSGAIGEVSPDIQMQNNFASLKTLLTQQGVKPEEVGRLEQAIKEDASAPNHAEKKLGPSVGKWLGDVTKTAVKAGTEAAIRAALHHYYGF